MTQTKQPPANPGRFKEAELAVLILDRWAGPKLWSWKRWRFSIITNFVALLAVIAWVLLRRALLNQASIDVSAPLFASSLYFMFLLTTLPAFAVSLSLTRYIAVKVGRWSIGAFTNGLLFSLLLALHLLLLFYWSAVVFALELLLAAAGSFLLEGGEAIGLLKVYAEMVLSGFSPEHLFGRSSVIYHDWSNLFSLNEPSDKILDTIAFAFKIAMDLIANGLRIVFALAFLSSFVFRPLIQSPISRLWYGAISSDKPVFTALFGAVGAVVAAVQALSKSHTPLLGI